MENGNEMLHKQVPDLYTQGLNPFGDHKPPISEFRFPWRHFLLPGVKSIVLAIIAVTPERPVFFND